MYYLRRLRLDGIPAKVSSYARRALLIKKKMSYKFNNASLDKLTLLNIAQIFNPIQKPGNPLNIQAPYITDGEEFLRNT